MAFATSALYHHSRERREGAGDDLCSSSGADAGPCLIIAISTRHEIEVWWLQLVGGVIELFLGFWAAGYYGRSAVLLIA